MRTNTYILNEEEDLNTLRNIFERDLLNSRIQNVEKIIQLGSDVKHEQMENASKFISESEFGQYKPFQEYDI